MCARWHLRDVPRALHTSTGVSTPSLIRFVRLAVAMVATSSTSTPPGYPVRFSAKWIAACSSGLNREVFQPPGSFNTSDVEQMRMGVLEHLGIAQVPAWLFAAELREGTVVRLLTSFERTIPILAVRPASRRMPAKVRIFIEHLEKTFALCSQFNPRAG